ncbi:MAG: hypothetical protein ACM3ML_04540 [Micromonosporaceae bacterium]
MGARPGVGHAPELAVGDGELGGKTGAELGGKPGAGPGAVPGGEPGAELGASPGGELGVELGADPGVGPPSARGPAARERGSPPACACAAGSPASPG